jgi:ribulose 1,5-bisphosphate synthetase/thiazole synthase
MPVPGGDVGADNEGDAVVDVAIVGHGPVGAVAAALLGQAGLRVHVRATACPPCT